MFILPTTTDETSDTTGQERRREVSFRDRLPTLKGMGSMFLRSILHFEKCRVLSRCVFRLSLSLPFSLFPSCLDRSVNRLTCYRRLMTAEKGLPQGRRRVWGLGLRFGGLRFRILGLGLEGLGQVADLVLIWRSKYW